MEASLVGVEAAEAVPSKLHQSEFTIYRDTQSI